MALVYSCCFWFSLRLGGIIIGLFSIIQAAAVVICCCLAYTYSQMVDDQYSEWNNQYNLIYSKQLMDNVMEDPHKYISLLIACKSIYLIACVIYIYGAYVFSNILMVPYIMLELLRLILITVLVAMVLLLLKENTMDIGSLIGASVVAGFFLLGMFYLWVCAANLPVLINEMERDDQAATIAKLQQLLNANPRPRRGFDNVRYDREHPYFSRDVFIVSNKNDAIRTSNRRSKIPIPY